MQEQVLQCRKVPGIEINGAAANMFNFDDLINRVNSFLINGMSDVSPDDIVKIEMNTVVPIVFYKQNKNQAQKNLEKEEKELAERQRKFLDEAMNNFNRVPSFYSGFGYINQ